MTARYERVPASTEVRRPFEITVGLSPGYDSGGMVDVAGATDRVIAAHGLWLQHRAGADPPLPALPGVFAGGRVSYVHGVPPVAVTEPALVLRGEVSVLYAASVSDHDVVDMLHELAAVLADAADQVRVYIAYRDYAWVLERHDPLLARAAVGGDDDESPAALPA